MINHDIQLVAGIIVAGFSFPSIFGALSEARKPWVGGLALIIGLGLIGMAVFQKPGGYPLSDVPEAFIRVVAYYFR